VQSQTAGALEIDAASQAPSERVELLKGWRVGDGALSLAEVNGSVRCPDPTSAWYMKAAAFAGLGGMIAVGYMDPGNWYVGWKTY
jgi:deoxycytidine triphosphate deaminase